MRKLFEYLDLIGKGMALFFAVLLLAGFVIFILMAAYHTINLAFGKHWIYGSILFTCWAFGATRKRSIFLNGYFSLIPLVKSAHKRKKK